MNIAIFIFIFLKESSSIRLNSSGMGLCFLPSDLGGLPSFKYHPSIGRTAKNRSLSLDAYDTFTDYEPVPYKMGDLSHLNPNHFKLKGVRLEKNVVPVNDYVLVMRSEVSDVTKSGVYVGGQKDKEFIGRVLAVGPGRLNRATGVVTPLEVVVGDTVLFDEPTESVDLKYNDRPCVLVRERNIFARIDLPKEDYEKTVTYDKVVPLSDRLLVRVLESPKKTESGLVLARRDDTEGLAKGKVIAMGGGSYSDDGKLVPIKDLAVGDVVLFSENAGDRGEFAADNVNYSFVRREAVLAKL